MKQRSRQFESLESRQMLTVTPELVLDIRAGGAGSSIGREWIEYRGELYFTADDGETGQELWKTDGTAHGTQRVKDIAPGGASSSPAVFAVYQDLLYFRADDGSRGVEIWRTDGTTEGTQRFLDLNPGPEGSFATDFTPFAADLFFSADNGADGKELYRTDGTVAGTRQVADAFPGPIGADPGSYSGLIPFQDELYFTADGQRNGEDIGTELFRSNGESVELVFDADDGRESSIPTNFAVFQGDLYFVAEVPLPPIGIDFEARLYRVHGDTGEVEQFFPHAVDFSVELTIIGDTMFFVGGGSDTGFELFRTDGTISGTQPVLDIFPGPNGSFPDNLFTVGDQIFFVAGASFEADSQRVVRQLWTTSGTSESTVNLGEEPVNPDVRFVAYQQDVYYQSKSEQSGWELFKTDGTPAGTGLVVDINPGEDSGMAVPQTTVDGKLLFLADNGTKGIEPWTWDGTTAEMSEIHLGRGGFTTEPELFEFIPFGNDLVFPGTTPFEGQELFVIRGSEVERVPGDADGNGVVDFADFLILSANFGRTDGSYADGDFDEDGSVGFSDFLILSGNFG